MPRLLLLCIILTVLTSCTAIKTGAASILTVFANERETDIAYGQEARQRLDVYLPKEHPSTPLPVIVFFHGGSWQTGNKGLYRFVAEPFTSAGYLVVIPDYGKYPPYHWPVFMEDAGHATGWVYHHIREYGGDPQRIFIAGHSAGAHMGALLVAHHDAWLAQAGVPRRAIRGFAGLSGPYDFVPEADDIKAVFEGAGTPARSAMPTTWIDGKQPPMLLLRGAEDADVARENQDRLEHAIRTHGGEVEAKTYPGADHSDTVASLSLPLRDKTPAVGDILAFFARQLNRQQQ